MVNRQNPPFPDLGEFRMVQKFLARQNTGDFPADSMAFQDWMGPGDDCARLQDWLITTDMSVEGSHFRLDWSSMEQAVEKCVLSNLSDLNAMGAVPGFALLSIALNRNWSPALCDRVAAAFSASLERHQVRILGGDTVAGNLGVFSLTLLGKCPSGLQPALRSAAQEGQFVYVSGRLGGSAAGLWALLQGRGEDPRWLPWVEQHRVPEVPLGLGVKLLRAGALGACMDLSDGLSSELHHIALQSGVSLHIREDLVPISPGLVATARAEKLDPRKFWLDGGEEYQLLFTSSIPPSLLVLAMWPFEIQCIGTVGCGAGVVLENHDGSQEMIQPRAWSHL